MSAKRNGAHRAQDTASTEPFASAFSMMQGPAANGFLMSQRFALEAARFWARRMRAYADQMETLAACASPEQLVSAQAHFIERLQEDYASESNAMSRLWNTEVRHAAQQAESEAANLPD